MPRPLRLWIRPAGSSAPQSRGPCILIATRFTMRTNGWVQLCIGLCILLILPLCSLLTSWLDIDSAMWAHLAQGLLWEYLSNSILLAAGAGLLAGVIGTTCAWCINRYQFVGRRVLRWALLLPMAMPAYIIAYTYTGLLDVAGPLQYSLRARFDWSYGDYWFPEVRSLGGAVLMLALVLYPYVYLLALQAFRGQSHSFEEMSKGMGLSTLAHTRRVALPLSRPAIVGGMALVMMEALADYGTVAYFGINTFTTGLFRVWFGAGNVQGAAQLATLLTALAFIMLYLEQRNRHALRYYETGQSKTRPIRKSVAPGKSLALLGICSLPVLLGFAIPVTQLGLWASLTIETAFTADFGRLALNSFALATGSALVIMALALLFRYVWRFTGAASLNRLTSVVSLGYAIPGTVLAVAVMIPLGGLDRQLNQLLMAWFDYRPGLVLSGTLVALILAYSIRFMAVGINAVEGGLRQIKPALDQSGRSLGLGPMRVLRHIHLPLMKGSIATGIILVFVDVLKELPATLILRPFNFNTLAVRTFELASDERLVSAALPACAIVLVGLLPVLLLSRTLDRTKH